MHSVLSFDISANDLEKWSPKTANTDLPFIRKADLENHNKDGGQWIVIHGHVYDIHDFKSNAPCGADVLERYIGKSTFYLLNLKIYVLVQFY